MGEYILYYQIYSVMALSFTQFLILGFLGACLFIGPKKILPRISETFRVTKQVLNEESTKAGIDVAKENKDAPSQAADKSKPEEK